MGLLGHKKDKDTKQEGGFVSFVLHVLDGNVVLREGETIGFFSDEKLPIRRSKGVRLDGETLKIGFKTNL